MAMQRRNADPRVIAAVGKDPALRSVVDPSLFGVGGGAVHDHGDSGDAMLIISVPGDKGTGIVWGMQGNRAGNGP